MLDACLISSPSRLPAARRRGARAAPDVEIVVPVYNEAAGLEHSIRRLHRFLCDGFPFSWRIVIADNASVDATPEIARRLARDAAGRRVTCGSSRRAAAARCAPPGRRSPARVVAYMDVDLSTDLRGLLPLVAPLMSGHSDLAIGTRLAHGSRVVRGPKREFISRALQPHPAHRPAREVHRRAVRLQGRPPRRARRACWATSGRRLVLRHRAAGARAAARAAHPRGAGRLGRRPRLARATSSAPRSTDLRGRRAAAGRRPGRAVHGHRRR